MVYQYSSENAQIYSQLGIKGTTYEISFNEISRLLGDVQGRTILDFGSGTGRSTRFLKNLGAERVIGVDRDDNMIRQAQADWSEQTEFHLISNGTIPLPDESVDLASSTHVLVEMRTRDEMRQAMTEIARVLKPAGWLIVVSTNPASIGYEFKSYAYPARAQLHSGDLVTCLLKGEDAFAIQDTYWTEEDYRQALAAAGFVGIQATFPLGEGTGWLDETKVAPDIVLLCQKPGTARPIAPTKSAERG